MKGVKGFPDKPLSGKKEDIFGVEKYIKGLSGFILDCATPMTVAVQGDWGSGKTSFMMLIQEEIEKNVIPIWFNTWQFSQFNLGEQLPVMLISKLAAALGVKSQKGEELKSSLRTVGEAMLKVGLSAVDKVSGLKVASAVEGALGKDAKDMTEVLAKLKDQFQSCVKEAIKERKKSRVVIFVDDLDRLQPTRAVELLEVLKLFLDCDDCVFLLAIDYAIVSQGIRQKYGETIEADKGRSFFDKIIQVPFKMPVAHYDVAKYVKGALAQMDLSVADEKPYVDLIKASISYNPRGMKRLLNAFLLLQRIHSGEKLDEEYEKRLLFAVLCLQLSYEEVYNFIVQNDDRLSPEFFEGLADLGSYEVFLGQTDEEEGSGADLDETLLGLFEEWGVNQELDVLRVTDFMTSFCNALANEEGRLTETNIGRLRDILNFSADTASEPTAPKGRRVLDHWDENAAWYSIDMSSALGGSGQQSDWNSCKLEAIRLFEETEPCRMFSEMQRWVLAKLYQLYPDKLLDVRKKAEAYKLSPFFYGSGGTFRAATQIPGTDIEIESNTSNQQKAVYLSRLMEAMGFDPGNLKLLARLAHWVRKET